MSSQNLQLIRDALDNYAEQMKIDLHDNPFAEQIKACHSPGAILQLLEKKKDEFKEYRDKNRKFIDCLNPVVQFVHAFSAILGEATSFIPFDPAKLVFVGIGVLFTAAEGVSASYDALLELFECIGNFLKRLEIYTKIDLSPLMTEIIVKIMVELLSILSQAKKQIKQGRLKQFAKKLLGDSEIENILRRLDRLTQDEARMMEAHILEVVHGLMNNMKVVMDGGEASSVAIRTTLVTMQDVVNEMNKMNRDRLHDKSISWLSPPNPSENQVIARRRVSDGSAVWFTQGGNFKEWNAKGCLLLILGKPGSGKSILCSTVIEESMALRDAGLRLTAYYYFDFRNVAKQDVRGLLSSLLVQLCAKSDPCYEILSRLYSTYDNGSRSPDDNALVICLKDMLLLPEQPAIYLIIDALDECPNTSGVPPPRDAVLGLIEDLVESRLPNLRICVTGRPEADILEALEPLASHSVSLHEEDGQKQDITDYVTHVVHSDRKMRKWRAEDKKLVIDTISEKADGMFRWVYCQLDALRVRIPGTIARALKELPQTLDETYERILLGIDKDSEEYARCLFQCLCVSVRPLRLAELADVLAVLFDVGGDSEDQIDWRSEDAQKCLISTCSSLITVVNVDGFPVVQFAHFTVREFLESDRLSKAGDRLSRYHVLPHSAHTTLARACLSVLLSLDDQVDKSVVEKQPLTIYAARHWVEHAKIGTVLLDIQDLMLRLFDQNMPSFAAWVWMYDLDYPWEEHIVTARPKEPEGSPLYYASLCGFLRIVEHLAVTCPEDIHDEGGRYVTPLFAAVVNREFDVVRALLRHGADVNAPGMEGRSPLHSAAMSGDCDAVRLLLEHQADVNVTLTDRTDLTPLHFAVYCGALEVCRLLVERGAHIDSQDKVTMSPLQAASRLGHLDIAKYLLDCGASLDSRDEEGQNALAMASQFGHAEVVLTLIRSGANVASRDNDQSTPLHQASKHGHPNIVQDLLVNGADPNVQDEDLQTPLHLASSTGYLDIVRSLIQRGAALDETDRHGETPLHRALRDRKFEVARFLIEHRANLTFEDRDGLAPLHHASRYGLLDLVEILLEAGVDINVRNEDGKTPLQVASGDGKLDVATFLIERGADVNAEDHDLSSPLHDASANGHLEVAELLVDRGADVDKQTSSQKTPLHRASGNGRLDVAGFLIKRGSSVGARDSESQTPLHAAARGGHLDVVKQLLELGADANVRDRHDECPFDMASRLRKVEVARFLAERMGLAPLEAGSQDGSDVDEFLPENTNGGSTSHEDTSNSEDEMSLHIASARGRLTVIESLLDGGIDVNSRNSDRKTALHVASEKGRLEVARLLIDRGADVNCRDKNGHTPLDHSSLTGHPDIARLLLDRNALVDTRCRHRFTPLYHASGNGYTEIVRLLIERGADVNIVGHYGMTPLRMARMEGKHSVIQLLIEHGAA